MSLKLLLQVTPVTRAPSSVSKPQWTPPALAIPMQLILLQSNGPLPRQVHQVPPLAEQRANKFLHHLLLFAIMVSGLHLMPPALVLLQPLLCKAVRGTIVVTLSITMPTASASIRA